MSNFNLKYYDDPSSAIETQIREALEDKLATVPGLNVLKNTGDKPIYPSAQLMPQGFEVTDTAPAFVSITNQYELIVIVDEAKDYRRTLESLKNDIIKVLYDNPGNISQRMQNVAIVTISGGTAYDREKGSDLSGIVFNLSFNNTIQF